MNRKEYKLPNGKIAVFEYDICGIGKITLECMDELMAMIADRPQGEWIITEQDNGHKWTHRKCSECGKGIIEPLGVSGMNFCPNCGARMKGADDE